MRSRPAVLLILVLTLLGLSLIQTPASAEVASISGVVTDAGTHEPLEACVSVVDADFNPVGSACTDPVTGEWTVPDLTVGTAYRVSAEAFGHASQWFDGVYDPYSATEVIAPASVAIEMERVAQVSGTLTQPDGSPASGFWVSADSALGSFSAMTDDAGEWFMEVPPGDYRVRFTDWLVTQYAFGKRLPEDADIVSVDAGATIRVDNQLLPVAEVVGTVTDTQGNPLSGICASVIDPGSFSEYDDFGSGCTDENGQYRIVPFAEGTFSIWFHDTNEPRVYAPEFAGDTYAAASAVPLEIRVGQPVTVDAAMAVGGVLTGKAVTERRPARARRRLCTPLRRT